MKDTLTILENQDFHDFDSVIENLGITKHIPSGILTWRLLPKTLKSKLVKREPEAMGKVENINNIMAVSSLGFCILSIAIFISLVYFQPKIVFGIWILFAIYFWMFLAVFPMLFSAGLNRIIRKLDKYKSSTQKGRLVLEHCSEMLNKYEIEYLNLEDPDSFAKQEIDFQAKVRKSEELYERFENHKGRIEPTDSSYEDFKQGSERAFQAWEFMDTAYQAFKERKEKVQKGLRFVRIRLDDLDFALGSVSLFKELNDNEQECAELLERADKKYLQLAASLSDDFEKMREVFSVSRSYLSSVKSIDPLKETEHKLLSAKIAGEELDKITQDWLPQVAT